MIRTYMCFLGTIICKGQKEVEKKKEKLRYLTDPQISSSSYNAFRPSLLRLQPKKQTQLILLLKMGCGLLRIFVAFTLMSVGGCKRSIDESCHPDDLIGLTSFKAGIRIDNSGRLGKWVGRSCCKWEGISCDNTTGRVTQLLLPGLISTDVSILQSQMKGSLSPKITLVTFLEVIDLSELSFIAGNIPSSIGFRLPNLRKLYLLRNKLTGPIPESIGKLSKLEEIVLTENSFSGSLPWSLGNLKNLNRLVLDSNRFSGPVPDSLVNLTSLVTLDLHHNYLNGHLPAKIGELQVLEQLDLSENLLGGKIPVSLTNITTVQDIDLSVNSLEGEIPFPSCSGQMPFLRFLALHDNHLTGRIPPALGSLVSLQRLYLENSKLSGTIPSSLGNLSDLRELYLGGNRFSGLIPKAFSKLSQLIDLNLSNNLIQGLPRQMSSLQNLQILALSFNPLNFSSIPNWIAELPSISKIYIAGCGIGGEIPEFLQRKAIQELDLSSNHLTGSIPSWLGDDLSQLYLLNLSNNALVSKIPGSITGLNELGVLDLHSNRLTGSIIHVFKMGSMLPGGLLRYIDLSDNSFSSGIEQIGLGEQYGIEFLNLSHNFLKGRLPTSIGRLERMRSLDLSHNELGFNLPESLGKVRSLERLKLQKNRFTGKIPDGYLMLRKLKELDLSDNLLRGQIPNGKPLGDFPKKSYSGNRALCGRPLAPCMP